MTLCVCWSVLMSTRCSTRSRLMTASCGDGAGCSVGCAVPELWRVQRPGEAASHPAGAGWLELPATDDPVLVEASVPVRHAGVRHLHESTAEVPPRARLTCRLRAAIARAARDRSTAALAADHRVSWWTAWRAVAAAAAECWRGSRRLLPGNWGWTRRRSAARAGS